ncbi:GIP [Symbiodinium sp. CCMP2456]|nr:GIP [Symbiodinium sp. CCMP2456]
MMKPWWLGLASDRAKRPGAETNSIEEQFIQEYVDRATDLQAPLSEGCRQNREMKRMLGDLRHENRSLTGRLENALQRTVPLEVCVATSHGERYHLQAAATLGIQVVFRGFFRASTASVDDGEFDVYRF